MIATIRKDDVAAVDAVPVDGVLLCSRGEVFQVKLSATSVDALLNPITAERLWYALGYGDRVWTPEEVASYGPLKVLWPEAARDDVSRETSAADPRLITFGTEVEARPRAGQQLQAVRGKFISWSGEGAMDRDAVVTLDVDGTPHRLVSRHYSFRLVR